MIAPKQVWLLSGGRLGDLKLMESVAHTLGWPYEVKQLRFRQGLRSASFFSAGKSLEANCTDPFADGSPDIVFCAEAPTASLAAAAKRAGGNFKLVSLARPRGEFEQFDLIIAPPQYPLPPRANILRIPFSPHILPDIEKGRVRLEAEHQVSALPRPICGVLVGGTSRPDVLDLKSARDLCSQLADRKRAFGGSILIITSPRTGADIEEEIDRCKPDGSLLFRWRTGTTSHYPGVLAVADEFVVTNDSVSMTIEGLLTGKPVFLFALPRRENLTDHALSWLENHAAGRAMLDRGWVRRRAERDRLFSTLETTYRLAKFSALAKPNDGIPLKSTAELAAKYIRKLGENLAP